MTVMEELELISRRIVQDNLESSDIAILGIDAAQKLHNEFVDKYRHYGYGNIGRMQVRQVYTSCGPITVKIDPKAPPYLISIGRITLTDILIEDILLDTENVFGDNIIN